MAVIQAYLRFDGNAREAFEFYKHCLGGEISVQTVGESPMAQFMPYKKDKVFHAQLRKGDLILLGSDMTPDEGIKRGNGSVLTLVCESKEEAKNLFSNLSLGGHVGHKLAEQEWGTIGDFQDKYGVDWFVVFMKNNS